MHIRHFKNTLVHVQPQALKCKPKPEVYMHGYLLQKDTAGQSEVQIQVDLQTDCPSKFHAEFAPQC